MIPINPVITIDRDRCTTPFDCKRCLRVCPPAIFAVYAAKNVRGTETDKTEPATYVMAAVYRDKCTGCMKCVEACPADALTVAMPQEVRA
jgi:NADH-quinone oxidoreductase subunit I